MRNADILLVMRVVLHSCPAMTPVGRPAADEVHVWVAALDRPPYEPDVLAAALTPDERDRAGRYRIGPVREQFVTSRGLLRLLLGSCLDTPPHAVPITYTAAGKPVLANHALHFNLTHTAGLVLVAVAGRRVGIDVERVRPVPDAAALVERFFSPAERAAFRALAIEHQPAAFLRGWVCKEAVIKAAGTSVQYLDGFDVEINPARPPAVLAVRHEAFAGDSWSVADWEPAPGFAAAVAVEAPGPLRMCGT
jgi:4'-phosphopantetheinyl transferase